MSDYPEFTPTTEQVRSAYAHDPEGEYLDPVGFPAMQKENLRAFDRWLQKVRAKSFEDAAFEAARPAGNRLMEFSERQRIIVNRIRNLV